MSSKIEIYLKQFRYYKSLADKAIVQIDDIELFKEPNASSNSIAVMMKHIAGNMLSRWTNIFEEDGEKTWRNREDEFINNFNSREELIAYWEKGWTCLFFILEGLSEKQLKEIIYIRNMGSTVEDAIIRQICQYPYHIGQIVYVARYFAQEEFKSLSIPKGKSEEYNKQHFKKQKSIRHFTDKD